MAKTFTLSLTALLNLASCGPGQVVGGEPSPDPDDPAGAADDTAAGVDAAPPAESPDAAPASAFTCSGAGIAAFADALVAAVRTSCTSDGIGVVTDTNYDCLAGPIFELAPPYPEEAFGRVRYWAHYGNNFSGRTTLFQCVDFAFAVTAGVCGQPINGGDAQIWEDMVIPGYLYVPAAAGAAQGGDVFVTEGHIAIAAQVLDARHTRMAEANYLNPDGSTPTTVVDTGVISNTRSETLTDPWVFGWYRRQ